MIKATLTSYKSSSTEICLKRIFCQKENNLILVFIKSTVCYISTYVINSFAPNFLILNFDEITIKKYEQIIKFLFEICLKMCNCSKRDSTRARGEGSQ